jgi:hypothetical protein
MESLVALVDIAEQTTELRLLCRACFSVYRRLSYVDFLCNCFVCAFIAVESNVANLPNQNVPLTFRLTRRG